MRRFISLLGVTGFTLALLGGAAFAADRMTLNFNPDWKFIKADDPAAAQTNFDDHGWATVSAPHTYNDVDTFDDFSLPGHRGEQNQWGGRTWYRKTFVAPQSWNGKKVFIEFEAVRQVAEVYLNGELLGTSKTGFLPFGFDLTPHLKIGGPNVLAVMCDNRFMKDPADPKAIEASNKSGLSSSKKDSGPGGSLAELSAKVNSTIPEEIDKLQADQIPWNNPHWHPAHGGIYRNVRLYVVSPVHISLPLYDFLQTAGPYVYASDVSNDSAKINLEVPVEDGLGAEAGEVIDVAAEVFDHEGHSVLKMKESGGTLHGGKKTVNLSGTLAKPQLWEPDYPYLYRVVLTLSDHGQPVDSCEVPLGIRTVKWDKDHGFSINGHHLKLHGWGQKPTDEWPGLGAAQPDWMHFFTLKLMKEAGGNFVRWGHSAAGRAQIESGDRLGIIFDQPGVDGESDTVGAAWKLRANAFRDSLIYFRNNPSILIWEGGNQKVTREHAKQLHDLFTQYDPHGGRVYAHRRADKTTAEFMEIGIGTEGGQEIKDLPVVEGEYDREESPRRVWDDQTPRPNPADPAQPIFGYPEAKGQTYQETSEQYAVNQVNQYVGKLGAESHSGGANWIFSDSTSGGRVACEVARASGEVDGVRLPKEAYYVCQAMFLDNPQVHIIGHWNYPAGTKKTVYVASNCDDVELSVNGKRLGHGKQSDKYLFTFPDVAWESGEIKAAAFRNGKPVAIASKHTVGPAVTLRAVPITGPGGLQADGSDVALIDVEAVDAKGERCPTFEQRADFKLTGPGIWRGGYNSGKEKSINNTYLDLECGINRVAVRSTETPGQIALNATCEGLKPATITIPSHAVRINSGIAPAVPLLPLVALTKTRSVAPAASSGTSPGNTAKTNMPHGKFIKDFSYSGPTKSVHVETDAKTGKKIYVDRDETFAELPVALRGADWIQSAAADRLYNAVDLLEIPVPAHAVVFIVHDDRLDRPAWLTKQFQPTEMSMTIDGKSMKLFEHHAAKDESLTLGTNTENEKAKECNMYIVFVNVLPQ